MDNTVFQVRTIIGEAIILLVFLVKKASVFFLIKACTRSFYLVHNTSVKLIIIVEMLNSICMLLVQLFESYRIESEQYDCLGVHSSTPVTKLGCALYALPAPLNT